MVRIKVYRASQVAVVAAAALLAIVLAVLLISTMLGPQGERMRMTASGAAVEVAAVFSVSDESLTPIMPSFQEVLPENEHMDETVQEIIVEVLRDEEPAGTAERPRVLIYHTHTHEAYEQEDDDPYVETEAWRTADQSHSVVRVGEALKELLVQQGFDVVHDVTDHEPPRLNTAYARSLKTLEGYAGEAFDLYIDLHRDAWNEQMPEAATVMGQTAAQLMVLIGNGGDYEVKPDYEANLRFATKLTDRLNALAPGLCRNVMVKNGRYNQHVGTPAILIEVGHNKNTLTEALASMPYLADALYDLLAGEA